MIGPAHDLTVASVLRSMGEFGVVPNPKNVKPGQGL